MLLRDCTEFPRFAHTHTHGPARGRKRNLLLFIPTFGWVGSIPEGFAVSSRGEFFCPNPFPTLGLLRVSLVKPPRVCVGISGVTSCLSGLWEHQSHPGGALLFPPCVLAVPCKSQQSQIPGGAVGSGTSDTLPACTARLDFVTEDLNPSFKGNKEFKL